MTFSRGFTGHGRSTPELPPGQYLVEDFPVLSAGPTEHIKPEDWSFTLTTEAGTAHTWSWAEFQALPQRDADRRPALRHQVVQARHALAGHLARHPARGRRDRAARVRLHSSYGGYTTNLPLEDLQDGKAWLAFEFDGGALRPEHGGPVRLLVPHLYLWKSAKWVRAAPLLTSDEPGLLGERRLPQLRRPLARAALLG